MNAKQGLFEADRVLLHLSWLGLVILRRASRLLGGGVILVAVVELLLGVLAVLGVVCVGGVSGYNRGIVVLELPILIQIFEVVILEFGSLLHPHCVVRDSSLADFELVVALKLELVI